jgi:hypothetical protein
MEGQEIPATHEAVVGRRMMFCEIVSKVVEKTFCYSASSESTIIFLNKNPTISNNYAVVWD